MPLIRKDAPKPATTAQPDAAATLTSGAPDARWSAARALARSPESAPRLGGALQTEEDARVREAIFTSLVHIHSPDAVAALLPYIRSPNAALRTGALDALAAMSDAVADHIPALLADPDPDVRLLVCDVVRRLPGPVATKALCSLLDQEAQPNVCGAAVEALSEVGEPDALPALARCAARFQSEPFLLFAIKIASDRIGGTAPPPPA